MKTLKLPIYSVTFQYHKVNSITEIFQNESDAKKYYNGCDIMNFSSVGSSFWNDNTSGLSCEMNVLREIPVSEFVGNNFETEEEFEKFVMDIIVDKSERMMDKYSYLSDIWNEELGKNGEFEIHQK